jgi:putative salt-induced outer membrane protein YdiY
LAILVAAAIAAPARAVGQAKFEFASRPEGAGVHWSGSAQVGLDAALGNSRSLGVSGKAQLARRDPRNLVQGSAEGAVARTRVVLAVEENGTPGIGPGELREFDQTTREAWAVRLRYDRFPTARGSAFVVSGIGADRPAGKRLQAILQLGYGRDLLADPNHQLRIEGGYDLTYEDHLSHAQAIAIHSARLFASYVAKPEKRISTELSVEVLTNLNSEAGASGRIPASHDTRTAANASLTWKLDSHLALGLRATARHDSSPAPRPPPPGASFEPGFSPPAEELDVTGAFVLIASLP